MVLLFGARVAKQMLCDTSNMAQQGPVLRLGLIGMVNLLTGRKKTFGDEAERPRNLCKTRLRPPIRPGQTRPVTKAELCATAMAELNVSKTAVNLAWIMVIEKTGRRDWVKPIRRQTFAIQ